MADIKQVEPTTKEAKGVVIDAVGRDIDPFEVRNGKPEMEYYWGPTNQSRQEQEKLRRGFEVCTDPKISTICRKPDGTHQLGDAILMQRPKEMGDREREYLRQKSASHKRQPKQEFSEEAQRSHVETFEER